MGDDSGKIGATGAPTRRWRADSRTDARPEILEQALRGPRSLRSSAGRSRIRSRLAELVSLLAGTRAARRAGRSRSGRARTASVAEPSGRAVRRRQLRSRAAALRRGGGRLRARSRAFAEAESDPEQMHDANRVAERVLEQAERRRGPSRPMRIRCSPPRPWLSCWKGRATRQGAQAIRAALHVGGPLADEARTARARLGEGSSRTWPGDIAPVAERADRNGRAALTGDVRAEPWPRSSAGWTNVRRDVA